MNSTHVDEFIDNSEADGDPGERYARFVLMLLRLPASMRMDFQEFIEKYRLFCTCDGKRYRVTMASRLGHIGLSENTEQVYGYTRTASVDECSDWGQKP